MLHFTYDRLCIMAITHRNMYDREKYDKKNRTEKMQVNKINSDNIAIKKVNCITTEL